MHNSPFTVAGMSTSTATHHHAPNLNTWGSTSTSGPLTTSFSDTLSQSRSHYQAGYLMSSQNNNAPQGSQRVDEVPVVQTKAKMNHVLSRGSASDFGMDSMFESSRQRQTFTDEDAPPTNSINDIPNEHYDSPARFQPRNSTMDTSSSFPRRHTRAPSAPQPPQPLYIVVFGYPADKYSVTVEYFMSLGESTEPDQNLEIQNCFRIGYKGPGDALRAVRKNGEVLGGSWMVGAKWADPAEAESLLGQPSLRTNSGSSGFFSESQPGPMSVDSSPSSPINSASNTPSVGTPIRLAPSASAFRRMGAEKPSAPQPQRGWGPSMPGTNVSASVNAPAAATQPSQSNKGVLSQMSDMIFGW